MLKRQKYNSDTIHRQLYAGLGNMDIGHGSDPLMGRVKLDWIGWVTIFYRAMHFSAKRGIAIACRLSVCLSVCL